VSLAYSQAQDKCFQVALPHNEPLRKSFLSP
jgi:hypothetical protein